MSRVLVINGPNLDQLGRRQPEIYGRTTLAELEAELKRIGKSLEFDVDFFQGNDEAALVERIGAVAGEPEVAGLVINPAALTHYSRALGDALANLSQPVVEVHISNVLDREGFRRRSVVPASYRIYGRGIEGYSWAIRHLASLLSWKTKTFRYGPLPDQYGDLRLPPGQAQRLCVLIHGGLWLHQWTADTTEAIAVDLTRQGFLTINLEYRRPGMGGGWPETFDDLQSALDQLPAATGIDPERIALIGHSAGATMALWAAAFHPGPVLAMAPFPDLALAASDPVWSGPLRRLLDGDHPPLELYSPQHRSTPLGPTLLAAAQTDSVSPLSSINAYVEKFEGTEFLLCDGDHSTFLEPSSNAWGSVSDWLKTRKVTL
ncbi:MAG: type II 3-dehydroquinate dehydratase [Acidimicrobiia bacterium]